MIQNKQTIPYSRWMPAITPEDVFSEIVDLEGIKIIDNTIYWLELRPREQGRVVLVKYDELDHISDITPKEFWIRTRVHEYGGGGGAYILNDQFVYFVNFKDQRIYRQSLTKNQSPQPLTPAINSDGSLGKYALLEISPDGKILVFVYEKEYVEKENENFIAALDLTSAEISEPTILAKGNDFYLDPKISPDGKKIVWVTWNHPNLLFDHTELIIAELDGKSLTIGSKQKISGNLKTSICQPQFDQFGNLYYIMDEAGHDENNFKNWWNIYCYKNGITEVITKELAEVGAPNSVWQFGQSTYSFLSDGNIICRTVKNGVVKLVEIDPKNKKSSLLDLPFTEYNSLQIDGYDNLVFVGASSLAPPAVIKLNLKLMETKILKTSSSLKISKEDISAPKLISYPTSDGKVAYGHLYVPINSEYEAPEEDKPPLLVIAHGGPTGRASPALSLTTQFWTSQGYVVLDVDYRGSIGYGRTYRDAMIGKWGVIDVSDIRDGVKYLVNEGVVCEKIAIRGGSAGGYAVQRALTFYPDLFGVGASYYGIGNLITLVETTHKLESRYLDYLIGVSLKDGIELYKDRSPIYHLDKLKAPMILFQGSEDKAVAPEVSREMAQALEKRGIEHEYHEYEGEAHGFRRKDTNVDTLNREARFYRKVLFGITNNCQNN